MLELNNTETVSGPKSAEFWRTHLERWSQKGGSLVAYAKANDLAVRNLYAARSQAKLKKRRVNERHQ